MKIQETSTLTPLCDVALGEVVIASVESEKGAVFSAVCMKCLVRPDTENSLVDLVTGYIYYKQHDTKVTVSKEAVLTVPQYLP